MTDDVKVPDNILCDSDIVIVTDISVTMTYYVSVKLIDV